MAEYNVMLDQQMLAALSWSIFFFYNIECNFQWKKTTISYIIYTYRSFNSQEVAFVG